MSCYNDSRMHFERVGCPSRKGALLTVSMHQAASQLHSDIMQRSAAQDATVPHGITYNMRVHCDHDKFSARAKGMRTKDGVLYGRVTGLGGAVAVHHARSTQSTRPGWRLPASIQVIRQA